MVVQIHAKVCKNQLVMTGRRLAILHMHSSTTIKGTKILTAPSTSALLLGPYYHTVDPKLNKRIKNESVRQPGYLTVVSTGVETCRQFILTDRVILPKPNNPVTHQSTLDIHNNACI